MGQGRIGPAIGHTIGRALAGGSLLMLAACGGGGSVNSVSNNPSSGSTTAPVVPVINYNDAEYQRSNAASDAGALTAYTNGATGAGETIAIIDSGIAATNAEFSGRIAAASRDIAGNTSLTDVDGHGTAVAAVAAAARNGSGIEGVAFGATILAIRADTPGSCAATNGCSFNTSTLASGVDYARQNGARVINLSLGGSLETPVLATAIDRATAAGIVVVIAGGNDRAAQPDPFAQIASTSAARGLVIIAGSHDPNGTLSNFSNQAGAYAAYYLTALGSSVATIDQTGASVLYSGTSFATPAIAGAVALLEQAFPNLTPAQVVALLYSSATDAGAAGVDATYGHGLLNIAKAFQPVGTTALAGSQVAVASTDQTVLSSAMGDATLTGQSLSAVAIDALGRAFAVAPAGIVARRSAARPLVQAIGADLRTSTQRFGPFSVAATVARGIAGRPWAGLALGRRGFDQEGAIQPVDGSAELRIDARTRAGFAFSAQGRTLADRLAGDGGGSFLVARGAAETPGFATRTGMSVALLHRIGATTIAISAERGTLPAAAPTDPLTPAYAIAGVRAERALGRLAIGIGGATLREAATVLGARLAPALGRSGATTRYLDLDARLAIGGGWSLGAAWRGGWTRTDAGGLLDRSLIVSRAASAELSHVGAATRVALRIALPPRVAAGGLTLTVPASYDYATGAIGYATGRIGLAPQGRERDLEASCGTRLAGGWIDGNLYWRREPGNIASLPDDLGSALRYSVRF